MDYNYHVIIPGQLPMPRLQQFLECIGKAVLENGGPPREFGPIGDPLIGFVRGTQRHITACFSEEDIRTALREAIAAPQETVDLALSDAIYTVASDQSGEDRNALASYLELVPNSIRQALRRPGDPLGTSVPEQLVIERPEDWLVFLPDRLARFKSGENLADFDNWQPVDLRGFGVHGETWRAWMNGQEEHTTASLKFITDPDARNCFEQLEPLFQRILDLEPTNGLVHLRSVYMLGDPPCLESAFVSGYDLNGLMYDWRLRSERTKPDQAALIVKRVARVVGMLHQIDPPIVHRGLKPSNILLHPTAEGKVTVWVSDIGWGQISSELTIRRIGHVEARRQARRGALAQLYASPQQLEGKPPDPRDDVYALGVLWYQMLTRDPTTGAPHGHEWALDFRKSGFADGHARLLAACVDPNPEYRPANGLVLASQIDANFTRPPDHGSKNFQLKGTSTTLKPIGVKEVAVDRAKRKAAGKQVPPPDYAELPKRFKNSVGMEFVLIPAGTFEMGSPPEERGRHEWEGPQHSVTLTRPYYIGVYPVTQAQYERIIGRNPAHFNKGHGGGPDHPVEQVSWEDAVTFCEKLTSVMAEADHSRIYRLPTEAEWEYACRAGTTTAFAFGQSVGLKQVHFFGLDATVWAKAAGSAGKSEKVGNHDANAWGLFDMHGNVLEWCSDWFSESWYGESPDSDPMGPAQGWQRVARGGSFSQFVTDCRSAARLGRAPGSRLNTLGFRVAMSIPGA